MDMTLVSVEHFVLQGSVLSVSKRWSFFRVDDAACVAVDRTIDWVLSSSSPACLCLVLQSV